MRRLETVGDETGGDDDVENVSVGVAIIKTPRGVVQRAPTLEMGKKNARAER